MLIECQRCLKQVADYNKDKIAEEDKMTTPCIDGYWQGTVAWAEGLASHLVRNRVQIEQGYVAELVEAAQRALTDYDSMDAAGLNVPLMAETYGQIKAVLAHFKEGEDDAN